MNEQQKADALVSWWIDTIYAENPTAEWKQNLRQEAALLPLAELFAVAKWAERYLKCQGCSRSSLALALTTLRSKLPKEITL